MFEQHDEHVEGLRRDGHEPTLPPQPPLEGIDDEGTEGIGALAGRIVRFDIAHCVPRHSTDPSRCLGMLESAADFVVAAVVPPQVFSALFRSFQAPGIDAAGGACVGSSESSSFAEPQDRKDLRHEKFIAPGVGQRVAGDDREPARHVFRPDGHRSDHRDRARLDRRRHVRREGVRDQSADRTHPSDHDREQRRLRHPPAPRRRLRGHR